MASITLKRLLEHNQRAVAMLIGEMIGWLGSPISITDPDGRMLLGSETACADEAPSPVRYKGELLGWVIGCRESELIARLLAHLARSEDERRLLAEEALNRYREVNLLYTLSAKLSASLDLKVVALTALEEARRLIQFSTGAVMLFNEPAGCLEWLAGVGPERPPVRLGEGIQGRVAQTGKAELVNDLCAGPQRSLAELGLCALLCAPLAARGRVIGILLLAMETPHAYLAGDLKLLNTLASQVAPAVDNAQQYESSLRQAREREERLQQQIRELRIELDEKSQNQKAGEITETAYFRHLQEQAELIRNIIADDRRG